MMYQIKEWFKLMFAYPPLDLEEVDYDAYWHSKRGKGIGDLSDWQKIRADFVASKVVGQNSIADVGSGDGSILHYLKGRGVLSRGIAIDTSEFALQKAKAFGLETIKVDIRDRKFIENISLIDYFLMFEILEHIEYSEAMLKKVYEVSGKGVFFSFPNTGFFAHRFRLLFGRFPMQWKLFPGEHLRFWTKRDLIWWLGELGFSNYEIFYYKGVPVLNKVWPSMFAAGFVVFLDKRLSLPVERVRID